IRAFPGFVAGDDFGNQVGQQKDGEYPEIRIFGIHTGKKNSQAGQESDAGKDWRKVENTVQIEYFFTI
ncbi:MAG TPA: hypothetical protein VG605_14990, partial [Puia sp.]|nr:hypothetical protein [Puia sp.]